ncbi:hypothetical protein EMIHUDRAFT_95376 [Emiliania huxleyi CCMP1516]|uniref:PsbP C-terminal domain-containing protein n=2 Tax=Emiliania huxleyi TaxID=2903 RepID=A0A0D3JGU6_EMIH1|nr:hypothetical protein EMIHUDRAFT_95376 [Emiliania huxleyi CCMP1516]EOD22731.1 hypothetical protein EMIHUDRAFT_95376 [Emiliania huxleyi CCMP1516]|eukprot:XP_005775160.1 hypothetical protein EMIHUDRAFT_95376 [Emiliania huxleyi CCMP1516]
MLRRFAIIATLGLASALRPTPTHLAFALSQPALSRRALLPALAAAATVRPSPALAADALEQHTTGSYQVTFGAPAGWPVSEQELQGSRYLYIATDPAEPDSANVVLTFQPLAADYTSLGSFGTQQLVGNSLMPHLGAYTYDYTIQQTGKAPRHLRTLFAVQTEEGRGRRLVTLTAQCYESKYAELKPMFQKVLESYSTSLK